MPVQTYAEQLERVQAAIAKIEEGAQSVKVETGIGTTRDYGFADLEVLHRREKYLRGMVAREERGGGMRVRYGTVR